MQHGRLSPLRRFWLGSSLAQLLALTWTTLTHADGPGELDFSLNDSAIVTKFISSKFDWAGVVAIQANGKLVVAGGSFSDNMFDQDFLVIRYHGGGSADITTIFPSS